MAIVRGKIGERPPMDWRGAAALPVGVIVIIAAAMFLTYGNIFLIEIYGASENVPTAIYWLGEAGLAAILTAGAYLIPLVAGKLVPWRVFTYLLMSVMLVLAFFGNVTYGAIAAYIFILNVFLQQRRKLKAQKPRKKVVFPAETDDDDDQQTT